MVVMDPNQIISLDDLFELGGEMVIDPEIPAQIPAGELGEVQPIMQDWPQHPIGKAAVIFLKVVLRQVSDYIFDVLVSDEARFKLTRGRNLAAPAEPDASVFLERRPQRCFEPASARGTVARNRNAVRNDE